MILSKEDFFSRLAQKITGSDEDIKLLEDFTDTYNELESKAKGDGTDWEKKYVENDKAWKEKYKHRFFTSPTINNPDTIVVDEEEKTPEETTIEDLFTEKKKGKC